MVTGAFILNAGLGKWNADEERAARLHGFAAGTYPFLSKLKAKDFAKLLAAAEITLGSAPDWRRSPAACSACTLKTPGMRKPGTPFPSDQGTALAKDVWMMGIALGLVIDELTDGR
jgi:hypothetical protein